LFEFGTTKLFMKNALLSVLETARMKAIEKKAFSIKMIRICYSISQAQISLMSRMHKIKYI